MKTASEFAGPARTMIGGRVNPGALAAIASMPVEQVRARLSEVRVLQARLDAEKMALNARMVSEVAPTMIGALVDGSTAAAHLDALGRGLRMAGYQRDEFLTHIADLVDAATSMSVSEFGRLVKETAESVVLDGRSVPIDVGRAKRLATAHQRQALEAVHTTCAVPECDVRFDRCHIHHIHHWEHGGTTDLANMIPLCSKHHHAVHEGKRDIHSLIGGTAS
ncbi:MAG: HNH endonuclease signature motif containing protein [Ilumatobacteraceae bacterium]